MTIAIGTDHGGVALKKTITAYLENTGHSVLNFGTDSTESTDYPIYAQRVGQAIRSGAADYGILLCKSGIGMVIAANKMHGIRAGEVRQPHEAQTTREHNNTNVLVMGAKHVDAPTATAIVEAFFQGQYDPSSRHARRVCSLHDGYLGASDPEIAQIIAAEEERQTQNIELIASENFTSAAVREAQGSVLTNKYAEGYPGKRWYGGCEQVDKVERLAIKRLKELFGAEHANVQPHSGSQANTAVYFSQLKQGDKILTMDLAHGGHLTHGHPANFSGKFYQVTHYGVSKHDERIDYDELEETAKELRPAMITAGASAYPRVLDWQRMAEIAKGCGALLFVDMAHIAGLVAAGVHPNPVPHADFVTSTTHKSLRGPRGGIILCKKKYAKKIDSQVFPGIQGGPLMHVIAAKAVCFGEALAPEFKSYQEQVIANSQQLAEALSERGYRIVSGGTDNHLMLVDLREKSIDGAFAQERLDQAGITVNKNAIPFDTGTPMRPSGIRIGTPAVTSRGMKQADMDTIAGFIDRALSTLEDKELEEIAGEVHAFTQRFPLP